MRTKSSTITTVLALGLVTGAILGGCSSDPEAPPTFSTGGTPGASGSNPGTGGSASAGVGQSGSNPGAGAGVGGSVTPQGGNAPQGGNPPQGGSAGSGAGTAGAGGGPGGDVTAVRPTAGCGMDPGDIASGSKSIATMGTKAQDATGGPKGAWSFMRNYKVNLPQGYVNTKAYPLVFQGPGCGGDENGVYGLNNNVDNSVIRVGLDPPPNDINHVEANGAGCFDDKEGDDSVDWPFYETLWDFLATKICFDQNRVFASGNSSGAWLSNELGCKYAGDATHPIRGIMPNTGGLPTDPAKVPTCSGKPMAAMWIHEAADNVNPFAGNIVAINRAMMTNGCTMGGNNWNTVFDQNLLDDYPIGGNNAANVCKKIKGCPDLYPLVVCRLPSADPNAANHGSHDNVANPGFATFIKSFAAP